MRPRRASGWRSRISGRWPTRAACSPGAARTCCTGSRARFLGERDLGFQNVGLNYFGKFLGQRLQVEATAAYYRDRVGTMGTLTSPPVSFNGTLQIPEPGCRQDPAMRLPTCPVGPGYRLGGGLFTDNLGQRGSLAVKASLFLPRHQVKLGADMEWNTFRSLAYGGLGADEVWRPRAGSATSTETASRTRRSSVWSSRRASSCAAPGARW